MAWGLIGMGFGCLVALSAMLPKKHLRWVRWTLLSVGLVITAAGALAALKEHDSPASAQINTAIGSVSGSIVAPGATAPIYQYNSQPPRASGNEHPRFSAECRLETLPAETPAQGIDVILITDNPIPAGQNRLSHYLGPGAAASYGASLPGEPVERCEIANDWDTPIFGVSLVLTILGSQSPISIPKIGPGKSFPFFVVNRTKQMGFLHFPAVINYDIGDGIQQSTALMTPRGAIMITADTCTVFKCSSQTKFVQGGEVKQP
jgi:hypothetical protein